MFAALVVVLVAALNLISRAFESPEPLAMARTKVENVSGREAVIMGPSTAKLLFPEAMCLDATNIAEHGHDLFEQAALARAILQRPEPPRVWIVGMVPGISLLDNGSPAATRKERRELTYRVLQSMGDWRLIDGDLKTAARVVVLPALGFKDWKQRLNQLRRRWSGTEPRARDFRYSTARMRSESDAERDATLWAAGQRAEFERVNYYDGEVHERAVASLIEMNRAIAASGGSLVLVYTPLSRAMRREYRGSLSGHMAAHERLTERAREAGITIINDSAHPGFAENLESFRDPGHMNYQTGRAYSRDLSERLSAAGLIRAECAKVRLD